MTYAIYEEFFADIEKKLNRIAKKCVKNGNNFTFKKVGEEIRELQTENSERKEFYKFILIEVEGTAKIDNWECVAVSEINKFGNIIKKINTNMEIPERFRFSKNICEHCNSKRNRNKLFIIHNVITNEWKQVGGSCLKLYTDGLNMEYIASYMDGINVLEEKDGIFGSGKSYFKVEEVIFYATELIEKLGYFSSECRGTNTKFLTSLLVRNNLYDAVYKINKDLKENNFNKSVLMEDFNKKETIETVTKIINYYKNLEDNSDFIHNIKIMLEEGYILPKNLGYICYLPQGYFKHIQKEIERAEREKTKNNNDYFGEVGKRYKDKIINNIFYITCWETIYGITYIYKIMLEDGTILTWKTSTCLNLCDNDIKHEKITFTVKEHKKYKGEKQTEVTRCKITIKEK